MIAIIGGGISGLLAGYALSQQGAAFRIYDTAPGGNYANGYGLKYLHDTENVRELLEWAGVDARRVERVGLLCQGDRLIENWSEEAKRRHYEKTRGDLHGYDGTSGNAGTLRESVFAASLPALVESMIRRLDSRITRANIASVTFYDKSAHGCDFDHSGDLHLSAQARVIYTAPLWLANDILGRNVVGGRLYCRTMLATRVLLDGDCNAAWLRRADYLYVLDQGNPVHRISRVGDNLYVSEANVPLVQPERDLLLYSSEGMRGNIRQDPFSIGVARATLALLGADAAVSTIESQTVTPGHLLPLCWPPHWPSWVYPLGRFAAWAPRATAAVVLDQALAYATRMSQV